MGPNSLAKQSAKAKQGGACREQRGSTPLSQAFDAPHAATLVIEGEVIVAADGEACRLFGVPVPSDLVGHGFYDCIARADRAKLRKGLKRLRSAPEYVELGPCQVRGANGCWSMCCVEAVGACLKDGTGICVTFRRCRAVRASDSRAAWQERMVEAAAHASPHPIYIFNVVRGRFVYMNGSCAQLLGYDNSAGMVRHTELRRHFRPNDFEGLPDRATVWKRLNDSDTEYVEYCVRDSEGEWHWLAVSERVFRRTRGGAVREVIGVAWDITARKSAEEALRQSRARLAEAQRIARLGHWEWTLEDDRMDWSESMYQIYGLRPGALDCTFAGFLSRVHPEDQEEVRQRFATALLGEAPYSLDFRIVLPEGGYRVVHEQAEITLDARQLPIRMIGTVQDVSDRKDVEEALRAERDLVQSYLNVAAVLFLVVNADETIRVLNRRGCEILDCEESAVVGQNWFEVFVPEASRDEQRAVFCDLLHSGETAPSAFESTVVAACGDERLISWRSTVLADGSGTPSAVLSSGVDITEQRKAEQAERVRQQQLVQADKMISLGILISGVGHEINNPNFVIMSSVEFVRRVWMDAQQYLEAYDAIGGDVMLASMPLREVTTYVNEMIAAQERATERIKYIVHELRDYARMAPAEHVEVVRVNSVVESAVTLLSNMVRRSTESFTIEYGEDLPSIMGNYRRLEQVVINLVQNACQALKSSAQSIHLRTYHEAESDRVVVEVLDEGTGIAEEHLPHIMDPFFSTKRDSGGTGLGLSISASIVHEHHGALLFDSMTGTGTRARMVLPTHPRE